MATNPVSIYQISRILAQIRPSGTGATTAYTKPAKNLATVNSIAVCNTTGGTVNYSVYVCINGTTYDQTTAIAYASPIVANATYIIDLPFTLDTTNGTVGVQTSSANALTFTLIGTIKETT